MTDQSSNRVCNCPWDGGGCSCDAYEDRDAIPKRVRPESIRTPKPGRGKPPADVSSNRVRCPNTIHSNYVTDHRCRLERGHEGDCIFGVQHAIPNREAAPWTFDQKRGIRLATNYLADFYALMRGADYTEGIDRARAAAVIGDSLSDAIPNSAADPRDAAGYGVLNDPSIPAFQHATRNREAWVYVRITRDETDALEHALYDGEPSHEQILAMQAFLRRAFEKFDSQARFVE